MSRTKLTALLLLSVLFLAATATAADRTVTVGDGGSACNPCDYASVDGAIDGEVASDADLTDEGDLLVECYEMVDTTANTTIAGFTTDATHRVIVRGVASERTSSNVLSYSTARYRAERTNGYLLFINNDDVIVDGMQYQLTLDGTTSIYAVYVATGAGPVTMRNNVITGVDSGATGGTVGAINENSQHATDKMLYHNNIIYDFNWATASTGSGIVLIGIHSDNVFVYNNTFVNLYAGYDDSTGNCSGGTNGCGEVKNNIFQDTAISAITVGGNGTTIDYNICDDTSCNDAANGQDSVTLTFENKAGKDFRPDATDTEAIDTGVDLSAHFTTDITGATRTAPWDIGFYEVVAGGGSSPVAVDAPGIGWRGASWGTGFDDSGDSRLRWGHTNWGNIMGRW